MNHPVFDPDWCLAPAVILRDWMKRNNVTVERLAVASVGKGQADGAARLIRAVLDRQPMTQVHADILARGTFVVAQGAFVAAPMWTRLEEDYRQGLAVGRHDWEGGDSPMTESENAIPADARIVLPIVSGTEFAKIVKALRAARVLAETPEAYAEVDELLRHIRTGFDHEWKQSYDL